MDSCASFLQWWIPSVASFVNTGRGKGLLGTSCPAWLLHPSLVQSRQSPQDLFPRSAPALSSIPSCYAKREQSSTAKNCSSGVVQSILQSGS